MRLVTGFRSRPRLLVALAVAMLIALVLPGSMRWSTIALLAWDGAVSIYLALVARMTARADAGLIRRHARAQDEGAAAILFLTTLAVAFSFVAIAAELHGGGASATGGSAADTAPSTQSLTLAGVTILLSWTVTQVTMALHYAGRYYGDAAAEGGLDFPGDDRDPDYADFLYFAFTMGAACQTSDVSVTSRPMRKLVLVHTALAFLFNTTILALAVNVGASLI
ncbi:DUF1345 domain-containing protein [Aureimonas jatrophae]|uniref:Uncharacterized membrane protein n=1 Tax=Aureimonas jatrophae TaxID=1166073 RepID=A0A1H0IQQ6_9HYPH|nr:DUF1345 domain-containing protein [Aureimonas jatrophae]MBB3952307.1 putative membrane protein [Aureimonas jatrophae]SDO33705.1 Uncharacterized membrane protein [Aureimonas jatrophae]